MNDRDALIERAKAMANDMEESKPFYTCASEIADLRALISLASPSPAQMDLCNRDGQPCLVGRDTDDAHWRCGTVACGAKSSPSQAQWPEDVVGVVQLYNIPELLDELNGRQRSCVDGREIVAGKYHDASVAADKLRAALATLPPPEDERVKGLVSALEYIADQGSEMWAGFRARSALASYGGGA